MVNWFVRFTYIIGGETVVMHVDDDGLIQLIEANKRHEICIHAIGKI